MEDIRLEVSGLYLDPNELTAPVGSLREALNVRIKRQNTVEPRPGFPLTTVTGASGGGRAVFSWDGEVYGVFGTELWHCDGSPTEVLVGAASLAISSDTAFFEPMGRCGYVTTDNGVYRIATPGASTAVLAGVPQGTMPQVSISPGGSLADGDHLAMRVVFAETVNGQLLLGAPSDPFIFANTSGAPRAMQVRIPLPDDVTAGMTVQLYTTDPVAVAGSPGDEMRLAFSHVLTAANITAGHYTDTGVDIEPRGASLYTNETQEGILQAAFRPPVAKCLAWWKGMGFYGDTQPIAGYFLRGQITTDNMVGYSAVLTATSTIGSPTLTAVTITDGFLPAAGAYVTLATNPYAAVADATAPALWKVVSNTVSTITLNANALASGTTTFHAYGVITVGATEYIVGDEDDYANDQFGTVQSLAALLDAEGVVRLSVSDYSDPLPAIEWTSAAAFSVSYVGRTQAWGGIYNSTPASAAANSTEATTSRVAWSKTLQPEAVPLLQYQDIGDWRAPVMRLIPTRDSLFVLKADGVWRITGDSPDTLRVEDFDRTIRLIHRRAADLHDNQVWAWTSNGIVALSEAGTQRMSEPSIGVALQGSQDNIITLGISAPPGGCFITGCINQECVLVGVPAADAKGDDAVAEYVYVYESKTDAWVRWTIEDVRGAVEHQGTILGVSGQGDIFFQRADTVDKYYLVVEVVSAAEDGSWVELEGNDLPDDLVGFRLTQGGIVAWITSEDMAIPGRWNVTAALSVGGVDTAAPVQCTVEWSAAPTSGALVHWRQLRAQLSSLLGAWRVRFGFTSERVPTLGEVYRDFPAPQTESGIAALRVFVTRAHARAARLRPRMTIESAGQQWTLNGITLTFEAMRDGNRLP